MRYLRSQQRRRTTRRRRLERTCCNRIARPNIQVNNRNFALTDIVVWRTLYVSIAQAEQQRQITVSGSHCRVVPGSKILPLHNLWSTPGER